MATVKDDRFCAWVCGDRKVMAARSDSMAGLPFGVKDVIATRDYPTQCGTSLPQSAIGKLLGAEEAACVSSLKKAGARLAGKTVTAELATYQPGSTVNPLSVKRTPGGSSSGSAAAVAAGDVGLALATQTAGSTIRPASFCGVIGFKPTFDRYLLDGVLKTSPTLDTLGLIADKIEFVEAADEVLAASAAQTAEAAMQRPRRLVLYRTSHWTLLPKEHQKSIEALALRLAAEFSEYREQDALPELEALISHQKIVHAGETASILGWLITEHGALLSDAFKRFVASGYEYAGSTLAKSKEVIYRARDNAHEYIRPDEVWLTPSVMSVAPSIETGTGDPLFCRAWTALGTPCLTMPVLYEDASGLPYGPQLIMSPGADRRLIEVGKVVAKLIGEGE